MTEAVRKGKTIKSSNRCNVILLLYSIGSFYFLEQKIFSSKNNLLATYLRIFHSLSLHMSHLFMMAHFVFSQCFLQSLLLVFIQRIISF